MMFQNRQNAGQKLAEKLASYRDSTAVVVGLSRGGVPVASAIASSLNLHLDVLVVKKIPGPDMPELALGALAPDGVSFINWKLAQRLGADEEYVKAAVSHQTAAIRHKTIEYRKGRKPLEVREKIVIVVDDGAATGATLEAAIRWLRKKKAKKIVVAVPVAPVDTVARIKPEVDELVVLSAEKNFSAVGQFYDDFGEVGESEIVKLLALR